MHVDITEPDVAFHSRGATAELSLSPKFDPTDFVLGKHITNQQRHILGKFTWDESSHRAILELSSEVTDETPGSCSACLLAICVY